MSSGVNEEIQVSPVRVEVRHGEELGIMPTAEALKAARARGKDLALMAPLAEPPLCEIMDMSRYIYNDELAVLSKEAEPLTPQPLAELPIPAEAKEILATAGFPRKWRAFVNDYEDIGVLRLDRYVNWWKKVEERAYGTVCRRLGRIPDDLDRDYVKPNPVDLGRFYRFGGIPWATEMTLECDTGAVWLVDAKGFQGYKKPVFASSSLALFLTFDELIWSIYKHDEDDKEEYGKEVWKKLKALDPRATGKGGLWIQEWHEAVEEF